MKDGTIIDRDGHAGQWGDTRAGALRGGAVPGKSAILA
jgi:hypothetical protein